MTSNASSGCSSLTMSISASAESRNRQPTVQPRSASVLLVGRQQEALAETKQRPSSRHTGPAYSESRARKRCSSSSRRARYCARRRSSGTLRLLRRRFAHARHRTTDWPAQSARVSCGTDWLARRLHRDARRGQPKQLPRVPLPAFIPALTSRVCPLVAVSFSRDCASCSAGSPRAGRETAHHTALARLGRGAPLSFLSRRGNRCVRVPDAVARGFVERGQDAADAAVTRVLAHHRRRGRGAGRPRGARAR
eukprot:5837806-Pleurochrysis_carterae.AAC.2